jgi:RNA ligase (TIGR02306 family)
MRKLASIQEIMSFDSIPGADRIELARIMGWSAVVKKGEFNVGDKVVYFEVDSYLPMHECYAFLEKSSYRKNAFMETEGYKIRTQRLRGCLSQGLIMPLSIDARLEGLEVGTDVTELLGVRKWEMPEIQGGGGVSLGSKPHGIPTTDELRVQSYDRFRSDLLGKPYYITTKMDGTSMTVYNKDGDFGVCGRNENYKDTVDNSYWKCAKSYGLPEKLVQHNLNIAIQGEFCGAGIQKNRLKLATPKFFVFDIVDLNTNQYLGLKEIQDYVSLLGLDMVPLEEVGENFNYSLEELLVKASGKYPSGLDKEGIVVRPVVPEYHRFYQRRLSFKVLNNDFLLKDKD